MKSGGKGDIVRGLALVTQLGLTILTPTGLFLVLGLWLDKTFDWQVTLPLLILGLLGGAKGAYNLAKSLIDRREDGDD